MDKELLKKRVCEAIDANKEKIFTKRRPKREAVSGFKMSYRYKYYNQEKPEEEEDEEL